MSDLNSQINQLVSEFATNVSALARKAAVDSLTASLEGGGAPSPTAGTQGKSRGKGAKRDEAALEGLQAKVLEYVTANPGMRIEQINKEIGTTTRDLQLPIRKLIAAGSLKTKGAKRATLYFAGARRRAA